MSNTYDYTDKVLDYFRNPRNMGELPDADGIGKVGNAVCLGKAEYLHTNCKIKPITSFSPGDKVISAAGKYCVVDKVFNRKHNGSILAIKSRLGEPILTLDHLILAKKVPLHKDKFRRTSGKKTLPHGWFHAGDLRVGDISLYPIFKEVKDREYIELETAKRQFDFNSKALSPRIPLNHYFLKLCGYYLSEGSLKDRTANRVLMFTFNIKEKDLIKDVITAIKSLWNLKVYIREVPERKTIHLIINNTFLVRFFAHHFGSGAANKKIPDFLMTLPPQKQKYVIFALWKGDGYVNLRVPRAGYTTISQQLAAHLKILLFRQKIVPSIYKEKEKTINGVTHRESYRFTIGDRSSLEKLFALLGIYYTFKSFIRRK